MNEDNNRSPQNGNNNGGNHSNYIFMYIIVGILAILIISFFWNRMGNTSSTEVTYTEFLQMVEQGNVSYIRFSTDGKIYISTKTDASASTSTSLFGKAQKKYSYWTSKLDDDSLLELLNTSGVEYTGETTSTSSTIISAILSYAVPLLLVYLVIFIIFKRMNKNGGGLMGVGKSNAKVHMQKDTGVTFRDVAGQGEAKDSLWEIVDFLHDPKKYAAIGAKLPKGALLVGPPGTGKTLLARAVAGEAKVPFFSLAGSDFVEMFVGVGASRVRDLFKQASAQAPCIIFIDELDAIGKRRDSQLGGNDEREQTLNQLLSEMDGFDAQKGIFILAATNRPEILDPALLRPGRFDRRIIVDRPDLKGRYDILVVHSRNVLLDETVDLNEIALATSGAVGADLANMVNEAAISAVQHGRRAISQKDLFEAVETVIAGKEKKDRILNPQEKRIVAFHEVGHALITAVEKDAEPVQKITIVPRTMGSLGYVMQVPEEEKYLMSKEELQARIVTLLGGRASEELTFGKITTGAANDMEKATELARAMVAQYGMSDKFGLMSLETTESQYLGGRKALNCSDETAAEVDREVSALLKECYEESKRILSEHKEGLGRIAEYLIQKETITGKEFMIIYNRVYGKKEETPVQPTAENA